MNTIFTICFFVGVGFTVLSFFFGEIFNGIDLDIDLDFGTGVSPIKPIIISSFLTIFGGLGLLLNGKVIFILAIVVPLIIASIVSYALFMFIVVPLSKIQTETAVEMQSLIGLNAHVVETIPQSGYGKITYFSSGNTYSAPAKSENGEQIEKRSDVSIVHIEKNTFYVRLKAL